MPVHFGAAEKRAGSSKPGVALKGRWPGRIGTSGALTLGLLLGWMLLASLLHDPTAMRSLLAAAPAAPGAAGQQKPADPLDLAIGQMIMVGFQGQSPGDPGVARAIGEAKSGRIGGVLLLGRNIAGRRQLQRLTAALADVNGLPPLLIAVDQEGGAVARLGRRNGFGSYPSAADLGRRSDPGSALAIYTRMAGELAATGINLNLGPVVDLDRNPGNPIIGRLGRSYGTEPAKVLDFALAFISAHRSEGVLTAAKHFPGHGSSAGDSHSGRVDVSKSWSPDELEPFRRLALADGAPLLMVGHLANTALAAGPALPASLSPAAVTGTLRRRLGYDGVVITDDLEMGAIRRYYGFEESVVAAVLAGNDILLFSNQSFAEPGLGDRIHAVIRKAVEDGRIPLARIEESARRIARAKALLSHPDEVAQN